MERPIDFYYLNEEEWDKAVGQLQLKIANLLSVFNCYGMSDYIVPVTKQLTDTAIDFSMRVRGDDRPIGSKHKPIPKPTD